MERLRRASKDCLRDPHPTHTEWRRRGNRGLERVRDLPKVT